MNYLIKLKSFYMESKLPEEIINEIKAKATAEYGDIHGFAAYTKGATEWAQWKVKYDEERKERVHLDKENDILKVAYQQLKERSEKMEVALKDIAESSCDYESDNWGKPRHSAECRACKAKEALRKEGREPVKQIEYMPIHPDDAQKFDCPTQFPMHLLDEGQAQRNHSQTLKRLKERGGLSVREILAIVGKKNWSYYAKLPWSEAIKMLNEIVINNPH
jgi:hypothetical protein